MAHNKAQPDNDPSSPQDMLNMVKLTDLLGEHIQKFGLKALVKGEDPQFSLEEGIYNGVEGYEVYLNDPIGNKENKKYLCFLFDRIES